MKGSFLRRIDPVLAILALVAAGLSLYNISQSGDLNTYYAAAVTSMMQSWHNFFFNSYDPGGFITIDKPPVAFWLQTISAKIFGIHSWSLALPSALGLAGSVILLYLIIKPHFGLATARISALILALTPIAVAVSRTNNADSTLVFFLMLAAYVLQRSVKTGKLLTLCIAFALVGVGFNTKMLQAFMVLPAFYLFYWLARKGQWKQKIMHLLISGVVLAAVSLSWATIVDLTPASERPYVGSSGTSNSVLELALGYNGISRLTGDSGGGSGSGGGGGQPPSMSNQSASSTTDSTQTTATTANTSADQAATTTDSTSTTSTAAVTTSSDTSSDKSSTISTASSTTADTSVAQTNGAPSGGMGSGGPGGSGGGPGGGSGGGGMSGGGGGGSNDAGDAGILRLLDDSNAGQIAWFLPAALLSALMLWLQRREQRNIVLFWFAWLLPMIVFFSIAGHIHRYYFVMMAPAIAALTGAGIVQLWKAGRRWWTIAFMAVALGTGIYITWGQGMTVLAIAAFALGIVALILLLLKRDALKRGALALTLVALLAAPAYWSLTPALYGGNSVQPYAGPELADSRSGNNNSSDVDADLIAYLEANQGDAKYLVATTASQTATPIILQTSDAVIAWGGFKGSDSALTVDQLEQLVNSGQLRYVLLGGGMGSGSSELTQWVQEHGTEISESEWKSGSTASATTTSTSADTSASTTVTNTNSNNDTSTITQASSSTDSGRGSAGGSGRGGGMGGSQMTLYQLTAE
ncbi:ArnT family glycosyltransferase [Paenibacillus sp. WLX2291]|uniref:ArnT family glycosyltransferase n=1 Tax=Paenibacillus sp. WLX2291 TaxID=3296934 RepID=UPI0039845A86